MGGGTRGWFVSLALCKSYEPGLSLALCKSKPSFGFMPRTRRASSRSTPRSPCPVACSLDLLGDRWTLLVVRDLFWGKTKYGEFLASPEGIPTNILADRLQRLEVAG